MRFAKMSHSLNGNTLGDENAFWKILDPFNHHCILGFFFYPSIIPSSGFFTGMYTCMYSDRRKKYWVFLIFAERKLHFYFPSLIEDSFTFSSLREFNHCIEKKLKLFLLSVRGNWWLCFFLQNPDARKLTPKPIPLISYSWLRFVCSIAPISLVRVFREAVIFKYFGVCLIFLGVSPLLKGLITWLLASGTPKTYYAVP